MQNTNSRKLNIISYNLKYNRALGEIEDLTKNYATDIFCIQECDVKYLPETFSNLKLADKTKTNRLGLATYYSPWRFSLINSSAYALKKAVHDRLLNPAEERLLVTKLYDKLSRQELIIGSFHASALTTNRIRRHQIQKAHDILSQLAQSSPTIMVGDYNYPFFRKKMRVHVEKTGYMLTHSDKPTYYLTKLVRGYHDCTTSFNATVDKVNTLPRGISDHTPILVHASI